MTETSERSSLLTSGAVVAATISAVAAVLTAVLPGLLGTREPSRVTESRPVESMTAAANTQAGSMVAPIGPLPPASSATVMPNLTFGVWTVVNSVDEVGTDFSGSTLKFVSQREFASGLEATGFFEWRNGERLLGREQVVANYDAASRQLFIEGKYVENLSGTLAVGSYSTRVSDDGRQLVAGTWGNTPGNQGGIFGKWEARR